MVVQDKNTGGIRICINLRKLNDACLHDPFRTLFTNELLGNVGVKKNISSLMDSLGTMILKSRKRIDIKPHL
jgi:hypothetical protein